MRAAPSATARAGAAWALVAAWAACVWWLGTDGFGAAPTSAIIEPLIRWLMPHLSNLESARLAIAVRKLAHPLVYGVLGALAFRALVYSGVTRSLHAALLTMVLTVSLAALDESRQVGLPNRTGSARDVGLDAAGAGAAVAALGYARRRGLWPRDDLG